MEACKATHSNNAANNYKTRVRLKKLDGYVLGKNLALKCQKNLTSMNKAALTVFVYSYINM